MKTLRAKNRFKELKGNMFKKLKKNIIFMREDIWNIQEKNQMKILELKRGVWGCQ